MAHGMQGGSEAKYPEECAANYSTGKDQFARDAMQGELA
jgi:hypothetical protein